VFGQNWAMCFNYRDHNIEKALNAAFGTIRAQQPLPKSYGEGLSEPEPEGLFGSVVSFELDPNPEPDPIDSDKAADLNPDITDVQRDLLRDMGVDVFPQPDVYLRNEKISDLLDWEIPGFPLPSPYSAQTRVTHDGIAHWKAQGGQFPVERGILTNIVTFVNYADIIINNGTIIFLEKNGPSIPLAHGCKLSAKLESGWSAYGKLAPSPDVPIHFKFDPATLKVTIEALFKANMNFGFNGRVKGRVGIRILGICLIKIPVSVRLQIGGSMNMDVNMNLALQPYSVVPPPEGCKYLIKIKPVLLLTGRLTDLKVKADVKVKVMGISIHFIGSMIAKTIRNMMTKVLPPGYVRGLREIQKALQALLDLIAGSFNICIPDATPQDILELDAALANIRRMQTALLNDTMFVMPIAEAGSTTPPAWLELPGVD